MLADVFRVLRGPKTEEEVAEALDADAATVRECLEQLQDDGDVITQSAYRGGWIELFRRVAGATRE